MGADRQLARGAPIGELRATVPAFVAIMAK